MAKPKVTAGLRCASLLPQAIDTNTPAITANAQPLVMTIQPAPSAFERFSRTPATTPSPNRISISVPMNSPKHFASIKRLLRDSDFAGLDHPVERFADRPLPKFIQLLALPVFKIRFPGVVH